MNCRLIAATAAMGLLLTAAAGCTKPFLDGKVEVVYPADGTSPGFEGVLDLLAPNQPLKLLFVHGMCTHGTDWVRKSNKVIAEAVGVPPLEVADMGPRYVGGIAVYEASYQTARGRLDADFLVWSGLTTGAKLRLDSDVTPERMSERAWLNGKLKAWLLDDCLADAVIYLGPNGDALRDGMVGAVCEAWQGKWDGASQCAFPEAGGSPRVVLVLESLGSKIVFDAVEKLRAAAAAKDTKAKDTKAGDRFVRQFGRTSHIFMLANQIPLLDLGTVEPWKAGAPEPVSSLGGFLKAVRPGLGPGLGPVTLVAFSDPNDLLSFPLDGHGLDLRPGDRLFNILVSNAWTILWAVEMPTTAHTDYAQTRRVVDYLMDGLKGTAAQP